MGCLLKFSSQPPGLMGSEVLLVCLIHKAVIQAVPRATDCIHSSGCGHRFIVLSSTCGDGGLQKDRATH